MMNLDNFDRAFELLLMLEEREHNLFEINLYKGQIYTLNNDVENAVREFELAIEKSPGLDSEELRYIPEMLMDQNYYNEALIFFHKFADAGDATAKIFLDMGFCYEQISNYSESEKYYEKSLDEDPFNEIAWVMMGSMYLADDKLDKAKEAFEFALSINNSPTVALICKTTALIQSNDFENVIGSIAEMMLHGSGDTQSLSSLAEHFEKENDIEEVEQNYMNAVDQDIDHDISYWATSKLLYAQGDIESAIRFIDKAIEINPDNEEYLYFRGQCFVSLSNNKDVLTNILQNAFITEGTNSEKFEDSEFMNKYKKAVFFYNVGNMEDCCKYLLESILINSEGLEMFFNLFPKAKDDAYMINYFGKYLK
jgi:tetratricopeptide (TPR) repeat protein